MKKKNKKIKSQKNNWLWQAFVITFVLSLIFGGISNTVVVKLNMVFATIVLIVIILIGVLFAVLLQVIITAKAIIKANKKPVKDLIFDVHSSRYRVLKHRNIIGAILVIASVVLNYTLKR
jgi:hypothetical protein